jgi:DNA-binding MarR family transcriptional regulator
MNTETQISDVEGGPELGRLGGSLGFLLRIGQVETFDMFYTALGGVGLKPGQFSVLWVIHLNPGVRQGTVAETLKIKPAHMTKLIRLFEDDGLISRHIPPHDRRRVDLRLTPAGEAFVADHADTFFSYYRTCQDKLTSAEIDQLVHLLQKLTGLGDTV